MPVRSAVFILRNPVEYFRLRRSGTSTVNFPFVPRPSSPSHTHFLSRGINFIMLPSASGHVCAWPISRLCGRTHNKAVTMNYKQSHRVRHGGACELISPPLSLTFSLWPISPALHRRLRRDLPCGKGSDCCSMKNNSSNARRINKMSKTTPGTKKQPHTYPRHILLNQSC